MCCSLEECGHLTNGTQLAREEKAEKTGETTSAVASDFPSLKKNIPPSEYVRHGNPSDFKKPYVKGEPLQGILKKPKTETAGPSTSGEVATDEEIARVFGD